MIGLSGPSVLVVGSAASLEGAARVLGREIQVGRSVDRHAGQSGCCFSIVIIPKSQDILAPPARALGGHGRIVEQLHRLRPN